MDRSPPEDKAMTVASAPSHAAARRTAAADTSAADRARTLAAARARPAHGRRTGIRRSRRPYWTVQHRRPAFPAPAAAEAHRSPWAPGTAGQRQWLDQTS